MKEKPIVSVICITYGHEEYIAQALDSFLIQKTDFPYQILVGEDKGPDRTAEIVMEYAEKYPGKIIPFIRKENMGAQRNLIDLCRRADTKYLAFCEGDDFWTDEYKLQKQYDFMEAHPEYRACFHNTRIQTDPSWYLYGYYEKDDDGNIFLPESIPGYDVSLREMRMDYYIKYGPAHTSSLFYRWDNSREIPEWYYRHIYGDHSLVMIQVGDGLMGYIPETMSVYRRSEVGVLMYGSRTEHFLRSRESWIEMACDLEDYFKKYFGSFANTEIRARIVQEFNTYLRYIVTSNNTERLADVYKRYLYPASLAAVENAQNYSTLKMLDSLYGERGMRWLLKDEDMQEDVRGLIDKKEETINRRLKRRIKAYSDYAEVPKDPNLWVFSLENRKYYNGNVRHLYEYILAYHPEIRPVWITKGSALIKMFISEGMPYAEIKTPEATEIMKKAAVAFVDQYRTQAFDLKGFNSGIKLVRLGTGIPLVDFSDNKDFSSYPELAPDITAEAVIRLNRQKIGDIKLNDKNRNYFTENYSGTFLQIAPNKEAAEIYKNKFGIPESNIFICGSPRSFAVPDRNGDKRKRILLIPAERMDLADMEKYYDSIVDVLDRLNSFLEETDRYLTISLYKSFSTDYVKKFSNLTDTSERINVFPSERDIFYEMPHYEAMITDRSSLMYDFVMHDKPVVIIDPENEEYSYLYDHEKMLPGPVAHDWDTGLELLKESLLDPEKYREKRRMALEEVCDMSVNDEDNSERIIQEVKRRLNSPETEQ